MALFGQNAKCALTYLNTSTPARSQRISPVHALVLTSGRVAANDMGGGFRRQTGGPQRKILRLDNICMTIR